MKFAHLHAATVVMAVTVTTVSVNADHRYSAPWPAPPACPPANCRPVEPFDLQSPPQPQPQSQPRPPGQPDPQTQPDSQPQPFAQPQMQDQAPQSFQPSTIPDQAFQPSIPQFAQSPFAASEVAAATSPGGYIDLAVPFSHFRLRYDAAWNNPFPDRAEFIYAKCRCTMDPAATGPNWLVESVDIEEVSAYLEWAFNERFSGFVETPYRSIEGNPIPGEPGGTNSGLGDLQAGFKYALAVSPNEYFTFQLRTYIPTGEAHEGLGTDHVSLEPGFLYYGRWDEFVLQAELRDWIPINGHSEHAGNVLRYGAGLGYVMMETCEYTVMPVVEAVAWSILDGQQSSAVTDPPLFDAEDTIVNIKLGVRVQCGRGLLGNSSIYAGWGHALTGPEWYEDIARVEFRINF